MHEDKLNFNKLAACSIFKDEGDMDMMDSLATLARVHGFFIVSAATCKANFPEKAALFCSFSNSETHNTERLSGRKGKD